MRDYVFITDIVRIIERFIFSSHPGVFNLATGKNYSIKDIVEIIKKTIRLDFKIVYEHVDNSRMFDIHFDNYKLIKALSGFQFSSIESGLSSYSI